jgi:hypothetical protein
VASGIFDVDALLCVCIILSSLQIRCVAAVLFHVGRGYETVDTVRHLLDPSVCPSRPQYAMAEEVSRVLTVAVIK